MLLFLTDLADEAVVVPLILTVSGMLPALGWRRGAIAWAVVGCATLGLMLMLKLLAVACGPALLRSPSGHTAAAALVLGSFAAIRVRQHRFAASALGAAVGAFLIGGSRFALGVHTMAEVAAGAAIGIGGAMSFAALAGMAPERLRLRWIALGIIGVLMVFHGHRLRAEARIWRTAYWLSHDLGVCRGTSPGAGLTLFPAFSEDRAAARVRTHKSAYETTGHPPGTSLVSMAGRFASG